jgi:5'-nucleotidase
MKTTLKNKLIVAISSRALFNLDESHHIYENEGVNAYARYQIEHERAPLEPGAAFALVQKLLNIKAPDSDERLVEVILLSRNSADTGLRVFNSIQSHELAITRAAFTRGAAPFQYANAFAADLFISADVSDVKQALDTGMAAATIFPSVAAKNPDSHLRLAFDGDAVLFSDEAERVYQESGLDAFAKSETEQATTPLAGGPFKGFLAALGHIQQQFGAEDCPVRTALVTARSAPAHERVIHTLRAWNIRIDEAMFLGGLDKAAFLKAFSADFYFDDQKAHCASTSQHVATGHVPHGVVNE